MILVHFHYLHIWSQPERERSEKERKFTDLSPIWWQKPSNISQNDLFALFSTQFNASTITSFQIRLVHPYISLMEGWSKRKRSKKAVSNSIHEISIFFRHVTIDVRHPEFSQFDVSFAATGWLLFISWNFLSLCLIVHDRFDFEPLGSKSHSEKLISSLSIHSLAARFVLCLERIVLARFTCCCFHRFQFILRLEPIGLAQSLAFNFFVFLPTWQIASSRRCLHQRLIVMYTPLERYIFFFITRIY